MKFSIELPLNGIEINNEIKLFDFHVHLLGTRYIKEFVEVCNLFNITDIIGITGSKTKSNLEKKHLTSNINFCYFLNQFDFMRFKTNKLIKQIDRAKQEGFKLLKIFFGPRLWKFSRRKSYYKINDDRLLPFYKKAEDKNMPILIHVADPDAWYAQRYKNVKKYGTKSARIEDFEDLLQKFPDIRWISAHLGSLPENLPKLSELLDNYPNLHVDTASTRWMIRELGKNVNETSKWVSKYKDRIFWGSDINNASFTFKKKNREKFWYSRFWSHRMFWETSYQADLAFKDSDSPDGTIINGLNLPKNVLDQIYYSNTFNLIQSL